MEPLTMTTHNTLVVQRGQEEMGRAAGLEAVLRIGLEQSLVRDVQSVRVLHYVRYLQQGPAHHGTRVYHHLVERKADKGHLVTDQ